MARILPAIFAGIFVIFQLSAAIVAAPVVAVVPERWQPPADQGSTIDFALGQQADAWLRHDALGDPSFDSFERRPGNPIVRGKPPFTWPVNGFLFEDPKSGYWYAYIGNYLTGYNVGPGKPITHCRVHRSKDHGKTWEHLGPIFNDPKFHFQGGTHTANGAPDVTVAFADNRYHLAYDWFSDNLDWPHMLEPPKGFDNGCAYAWSERPEGPFHRAANPILRTTDMARRFDPGKKYRRAYGTGIIHRKKDWLVLVLADSNDYFSWGLMAMTAADPAGAWSNPVMVLSDESDRFFPHTAEPFPMMVYDGYVYAPYASVALNRNFQAIYRAKVEDAHRPEAWQLFQYGTAWHSEPVVNEGMGIWGQSFSGFVDRDGQFQVLFPSRERETNLGTISLADAALGQTASRPGIRAQRSRGPEPYAAALHVARIPLAGRFHTSRRPSANPLGVRRPARPRPPRRRRDDSPAFANSPSGLELSANAWRMVNVDAAGKLTVTASGALENGATRAVEIDAEQNGPMRVAIDQKIRWTGNVSLAEGQIGLLVDPFTNLSVSRFEISGRLRPAIVPWLYIEALTGAGVRLSDWDVVRSPLYRFGIGAVGKTPGGRVKWNFRGRSFLLWSPKGPQFGRCELLIDGRKAAELDFHSDREQRSWTVYDSADVGDGYHAVVLHSIAGRLPVDALDAVN